MEDWFGMDEPPDETMLEKIVCGIERLLEADAKNHDMLAAGEMKWRTLFQHLIEKIEDCSIGPCEHSSMEEKFEALKSATIIGRELLGVTRVHEASEESISGTVCRECGCFTINGNCAKCLET